MHGVIEILSVFWLPSFAGSNYAREMIASGIVAHVVCIAPNQLDRRFAGRRFDHDFLADLPPGVDPCGENGEFHTVVSAGPMFQNPIGLEIGDIIERDGFIFADAFDLEV